MAEISRTLRLLNSQINKDRQFITREAGRIAEAASRIAEAPTGPIQVGDASRLVRDAQDLLVRVIQLDERTQAMGLLYAENSPEEEGQS